MKLLIEIAILLNVYGVLSSPEILKLSNRAHHHHDANSANELTVDDLADVLISLPEPLDAQAYKTFLMLGRFLPADTKAHKFFMSIPNAIKRKTKEEISQPPAVPGLQPSANPIFMTPPAGYRMMPLPLHPMFSPSPLDNFTRVPCRHSKFIRVPLHMFDVEITATTRRFMTGQSLDSDEDGFENDEDDDGLNELLDLISNNSDVDEGFTSLEPAKDKESEEKVDPENNPTESNNDKPITSEEEIPKENVEESSSMPPKEESAEVPESESAKIPDEEPTQLTEEEPTKVIEEESTRLPEEGTPEIKESDTKTPEDQTESPKLEETSAPASAETQPPIVEELTPSKDEAPLKDEAEPATQEIAEANEVESNAAESSEVESQKSVEKVPEVKKPGKRRRRKNPNKPKKGTAVIVDSDAEQTEVQEPKAALASDEDETGTDATTKPIQPKRRARKKKVQATTSAEVDSLS